MLAIISGYIVAVFILLVAIGVIWLRERETSKTVAAYERLLTKRDTEYTELADRFFIKNKLPATGIDLAQVSEERREEAKQERQQRQFRPPAQVGSVDKARSAMIHSELRDLQTARDSRRA